MGVAQHKRNLKQAISEHESYITRSNNYTKHLKKILNRYKAKLSKLEKE